jgi:hypothetical protein
MGGGAYFRGNASSIKATLTKLARTGRALPELQHKLTKQNNSILKEKQKSEDEQLL